MARRQVRVVAAVSEAGDVEPDRTVESVGAVSHAVFRVARLHKMMAGRLLRETGLYPNQELLMMRLWDHGPQRQVDLVRHLDTDAPTMARTVRRLEKAGYVRMSPSETDRRATIVEATRASLPLRKEVTRIWAQLEAASIGALSTDESAVVLASLERLERNLIEAESGSPLYIGSFRALPG
jgi:DNA-binding MarR family transcriptional regulator